MVCTRFGSSRQSRQLQALQASFLAGSESDVRHWHRGFGSAVGTGMPWCFPVSEAAAKAVSCRLRKRREAVAPGLRKRRWDRHAMVFTRFGSGRQSRQLQASKASFLAGSESDVRHWHRGFGSAVGTGMPWCFPVGSGRQSSQLQAQKATLGSGTGASEAPLGPACHGVYPFRKRPPKPSAAGFKG